MKGLGFGAVGLGLPDKDPNSMPGMRAVIEIPIGPVACSTKLHLHLKFLSNIVFIIYHLLNQHQLM
jgi:hypothetical protein